VLQEEGAALVDVEVMRPTMELYRTVQMPEATLAHLQRGWLREKRELYGEGVLGRLLQGQAVTAVDYLQAQHERRVFSSNVRAVMQSVDVLVLPTLPIAAVPIEKMGQDIEIDGVTENATVALLRLTMPWNLAGLPAVSLPCGFTTDGLPIGLQVVGKPFEEATVLRIAHAYQQLTDWHRREPDGIS
jgi:aspartyl-tRNA(Asn)/glutamyl-tRNA(Gln) amidotransferase subunit A